ncbi:hypothetical protein H8K35_06595 [Undibacterium sp. LX40W]|uniref:Nuclear transport factor 2 family protein n=1 Tax=Undibacterium nitidum TaxID=2762298 RepID=A0A923KJS1_9BURK|nr:MULTISPECIES: hypothetical protein [Undibacterium]MBC3879945.1 hypothetical protein [Undibacterium nitidum]MBC3891319.1 hypothetical protein [Undibacterium sp. LX40W]
MNKLSVSACCVALGLFVSALTNPAMAVDNPTMLTQASPVSVVQPPARAADVQSIDGIIAALYDVISGGIGEQRNWNRMRSLFIPEARIMAIFPKKDSKDLGLRILSISDYIANSGPRLIEIGFREKELARKTEQWGELAQVFTSYETFEEKDNVTRRGINSVQLMHDGTRWWIISLLFEAERPQLQLPDGLNKASK